MSKPPTPAIDVSDIIGKFGLELASVKAQPYTLEEYEVPYNNLESALNQFYAEEMLKIVGNDLEEGDGWDWAFGDEARCCPGDDFAYFGNHIKKQIRTAIKDKFLGGK